MAKKPKSPKDVFAEFINDIKQAFGRELVGIHLFGSGAKGEYDPKHSDINFLVVLTEAGIQTVDRYMPFMKKWNKRGVAVPLFLTENYIKSSLDAFPIEFLNMQKFNQLVYGQDVLEKLKIESRDLRLKCEEQVKGKLLHLREEFLRTGGRRRLMKQLLNATVPAFASIFTALLQLKEVAPPAGKKDTMMKGAQEFGLNESVINKVLQINALNPGKEELYDLCRDYIEEIRKLAKIVDQW